MKRKTSENNENDRETKRQRLIDSAIDIQYLFDYLPVEIWVDHKILIVQKIGYAYQKNGMT